MAGTGPGGPAGARDAPVLADLLSGAVPFVVPLRRRFRGVTVREGLLLRGPAGWGEFAPFPEYPPAVCARWLAAAVEAAYDGWPAPVRSSIPVNAIVPAVPAADAAALTHAAVTVAGCRTVKVKVAERGDGLAADEARVAAVRAALDAALGPGVGRLRVDANGAWSLAQAAAALRVLGRYDLEYAEQPCATLVELAALRRRVSVPLAVDESVRTAADPQRVRLAGVADVVILKVPPLGGVRAALAVAAAAGVPAVVSGALDTAVGLSAGLALAGALPDLPLACGLGTGALLARDLVADPRVPRDGSLAVAPCPPDPDALAAAAGRMPAERIAWWRDRLVAAWTAGPPAP